MESSGGPEKLLGGSTLRKSQKEGKAEDICPGWRFHSALFHDTFPEFRGLALWSPRTSLFPLPSPASSSTSSSLADSSTRPITMLQTNVLAPGHADLVTRESELAESTEHDG